MTDRDASFSQWLRQSNISPLFFHQTYSAIYIATISSVLNPSSIKSTVSAWKRSASETKEVAWCMWWEPSEPRFGQEGNALVAFPKGREKERGLMESREFVVESDADEGVALKVEDDGVCLIVDVEEVDEVEDEDAAVLVSRLDMVSGDSSQLDPEDQSQEIADD
ncbi:MAG: hypothetical protein M1836_001911 [Candelina mexicana]|nr:MAG: hypothetical protein M1836_001911 [Candelina mexicana]